MTVRPVTTMSATGSPVRVVGTGKTLPASINSRATSDGSTAVICLSPTFRHYPYVPPLADSAVAPLRPERLGQDDGSVESRPARTRDVQRIQVGHLRSRNGMPSSPADTGSDWAMVQPVRFFHCRPHIKA